MADVRLAIAGRSYDVHCADGEEDRLQQLAALVDAKARSTQVGTEVRQLLFAALILADEAYESQNKAGDAQPQLDALRAAVALAESRAITAQDELRAAVGREQAALDQAKAASEREQAAQDELEKMRQQTSKSPMQGQDQALAQIADRIESLATKVEQMS